MRFGMFIPQGWRLDLAGIDPADHWATMSALARRADEGEAWESIWVYDHFHTTPEPTAEATHEAWTLMAAFAAATERVRLGQMCTCLGYRNPAYLAKVAATVDVVSGGRTEMGIGAGWYEHEFEAYGYGFPSAGRRIAALREGVEIMRRAWAAGTVTYAGEHHRVDGAIVQPRPLQEGGIPMWIAGGGERKTLRIAAEFADYTNFDGTPDAFAHKSEVLRAHCADVGRDFGEITRSANFNVIIGASERDVADRLAWAQDHYVGLLGEEAGAAHVAGLRRGPLVGTPEQIVETLAGLRGAGLAYAIAYFVDAAYDRASIELFEREVIPALR